VFDDWRDDFIASLSGDLNVRRACIAASISRANAYKRRETDDEFRLAWDEAIENASDLLEGVYWQRAVEQSDRALEFLLRANRREKYGDKIQLDAVMKLLFEQIDYSTLSAAQIEALANGDNSLTVLLGTGPPDSRKLSSSGAAVARAPKTPLHPTASTRSPISQTSSAGCPGAAMRRTPARTR
jgi:hypothetical protein